MKERTVVNACSQSIRSPLLAPVHEGLPQGYRETVMQRLLLALAAPALASPRAPARALGAGA
jgi:hypothetical protein